MASGFIVLRDGRCLSVRWPVHDAVLRAIVEKLDERSPLALWLAEQLPRDGDVELSYAFVRENDGEQVARAVDVRGLTDENRTAFEEAALIAARSAEGIDAVVRAALDRLRRMIECARAGEPPLELSDWTTVAPPCTVRSGPGWQEA
jgi:hypothetical protein